MDFIPEIWYERRGRLALQIKYFLTLCIPSASLVGCPCHPLGLTRTGLEIVTAQPQGLCMCHDVGSLPLVWGPLVVGRLQVLCWVWQGDLCQDGARQGLKLGSSPLRHAATISLRATICLRCGQGMELRKGGVPQTFFMPLSSLTSFRPHP